jgi:hypothetical protein
MVPVAQAAHQAA